MPDYYDRLEAQLGDLTARGAHRSRRRSLALPRVQFGVRVGNVTALAASALVAVVVAAAVLTVGSRHQLHPVGPVKPPVIRNIYPAQTPAAPGRLVFAARMAGPQGARAPVGEARFYAVSPTRTEMILRASGLRKLRGGKVYAVWLYPGSVSSGVFRVGGWAPQLVGVVEPPVGRDGHLTITHVFPDSSFGGPNRLEIAVQAHGSLTAPGPVVLGHFVDF